MTIVSMGRFGGSVSGLTDIVGFLGTEIMMPPAISQEPSLKSELPVRLNAHQSSASSSADGAAGRMKSGASPCL